MTYTPTRMRSPIPRTTSSGGGVIAVFLAGLVLSVLYALAAGWALMLAVGVVRGEWLPDCPTIGYWPAVLVAALLRTALHPVSTPAGQR